MKRALFIIVTLLFLGADARAYERFFAYCNKGGINVSTQGLMSTAPFQASFPQCTVTVYYSGTAVQVPSNNVYANNLSPTPTVLGNPFTAAVDAYTYFYAAAGRYDLLITSPTGLQWTWSDIELCDPLGPNADTGCGGGSGSSALWSSLRNPLANLTLNFGSYTSTFNYSSSSGFSFRWANSTAATASVSQSMPPLYFSGNYWNSTASAVDTWGLYPQIGSGTNGSTTFNIAHISGTSGAATVAVPNLFTPGTVTGTGGFVGNASTASQLVGTPIQCTGIQFAQGISPNGNANCATPSGSGGTSVTISTNGTQNSSQVILNMNTSTTNAVGLTVTPHNPSGGVEIFEITGLSYTGNASTATTATTALAASSLASTPSQCTGTQFAQGIAANGNANCATPSGSGGSSPTIATNGTNNTSQSLLSMNTSTVNSVGLEVTPANPSGGIETFEITGSSYSGNAATATTATTATTASTATALASTPSQCTGTQFAQGIAANGNANCATPSGSGGTSLTVATNGTNNVSQALLNLSTSTINAVGLSVTPHNTSGGIETFELSGTSYSGNAATATTASTASTATALASTPTQCSPNNWSTGIAANGNANCSQPAFSNLSGTASAAQIPAALPSTTSVNGTTIPSGGVTITRTVASGTIALATSSIPSLGCQAITAGSVNSIAATGVVSTDRITWNPSGSIKAVTGYTPSLSGGLSSRLTQQRGM